MPIVIKNGNIFDHINKCIIVHSVNSEGRWGAGFVLSLSQINKNAEKNYRKWYKDSYTQDLYGNKIPFELGNVQYCWLDPPNNKKNIVANLIGQDLGNSHPRCKIDKINKGLQDVKNKAEKIQYDVVSPLIGCGLGGETISNIYKVIDNIYRESNVDYYLYAFSDKDFENLKAVAKYFA